MTMAPGTNCTQKGDVYSFGIILEEIVVRGGPYQTVREFLETKGKVTRNCPVDTIINSIKS